jgi:hypothetical protein
LVASILNYATTLDVRTFCSARRNQDMACIVLRKPFWKGTLFSWTEPQHIDIHPSIAQSFILFGVVVGWSCSLHDMFHDLLNGSLVENLKDEIGLTDNGGHGMHCLGCGGGAALIRDQKLSSHLSTSWRGWAVAVLSLYLAL